MSWFLIGIASGMIICLLTLACAAIYEDWRRRKAGGCFIGCTCRCHAVGFDSCKTFDRQQAACCGELNGVHEESRNRSTGPKSTRDSEADVLKP